MNRILAISRIVWLEVIRRKDPYLFLVMLSALLAGLLSFNIFGLEAVTGYIKDVGLLAVWILGWILAVNTSARQLPGEERRGTLLPLLAKPVSRLEVITGKWLGAWSVTGTALLCFYLTLLLAVLVKHGSFEPETLLQAFLLHLAVIAMITALGIAFSTRLNHDATAVMTYLVSGASILLLPNVPSTLATTHGAQSWLLYGVYYLLPHFELCDLRRRLIHDWGHADWLIATGILIYSLCITTVFLTLAWLGYRNRHFSRGAPQ